MASPSIFSLLRPENLYLSKETMTRDNLPTNDVSPVKNYDPLLPRQNWPRTNPGTLSRMQPLRVAGAKEPDARCGGRRRMRKVIVW